jgi:hypothetical protein
VRVAVFERKFSEIDGTSLRRYGPENVGQIFEAELGGVFEILEFDFNLKIGLLAFHLGFAGGALKKIRSLEIDSGGAPLQTVVYGFGRARN